MFILVHKISHFKNHDHFQSAGSSLVPRMIFSNIIDFDLFKMATNFKELSYLQQQEYKANIEVPEILTAIMDILREQMSF